MMRFREDEEVGEDAMKHHLVQQFSEANSITMPGTRRPLYAQNGTIELVTLEKVSGAPPKVNRLRSTKTKCKQLQLTIFDTLERPNTQLAVLYHATVFLLILGSLFLSVLLTMKSFESNQAFLDSVYHLEIALAIVFGLEYMLRIWSCSIHGNYKGFWGKLRFVRKPYMVIDIIVIVATTVVVATTDQSNKSNYFGVSVFRFLRFLQVLRILRLDRQRGAFKIVSNVVYEHRQELLTCWYMSFILLVACAFLVYLAENSTDDPENGNQMQDLGEGMYFALITLLTVGYGDISPQNWVSRILTCIFAFVGTAFFALPAGILGSGFALQVAQNKKQKHFNRRRYPAALVIQYAWRQYASTPRFNSVATWLPHQSIVYSKEKENKKYSMYGRSPAVTPVNGRKISYLRKKFNQNHKLSYADGDDFNSRRSSIAATIPTAIELRDRCQSDGNLLLVSPRNVEENQATIVTLPPDYAESLRSGMDRQGLTPHHYSHQDIQFKPLTEVEKNAIRFIRKIKYKVAIKKFKEECQPYDVKDVIEQYTEGQMDMYGCIKRFQTRLEAVVGVRIEEEYVDPASTLSTRLNIVEEQVYIIDSKVDRILQLLTDRSFRHRHRDHGDKRDRSDSKESLGVSSDSIYLHEYDTNCDEIDNEVILNNAGRIESPRDRRRGMSLQADELSRRLEQLKYESSDSSLDGSDNDLHISSNATRRRSSRFTVTPITPDKSVDLLLKSSLKGSSKSSLPDDSKYCNTAAKVARKCLDCASKSLLELPEIDNSTIQQSSSAPSIASNGHSKAPNCNSKSPSSINPSHLSNSQNESSNLSSSTSANASGDNAFQSLQLHQLFSSSNKDKTSVKNEKIASVEENALLHIEPNDGIHTNTEDSPKLEKKYERNSTPFELNC